MHKELRTCGNKEGLRGEGKQNALIEPLRAEEGKNKKRMRRKKIQ